MTTRYNSIYECIYFHVVTPRLGLAICLASASLVVYGTLQILSNF
jgi:hypothetical protein